MRFILTNHAKYRLMERGISISDIKQTIKLSQHKIDKYGMIVARKLVGKRTLEIFYKIQGASYIIITAYYYEN